MENKSVERKGLDYKVYSTKLNKVFDTVKELKEAEEKELKAKEEKSSKAKAVEEAYKSYVEEIEKSNKAIAEKKKIYLNLRNEFVKQYGSFHTTVSKTFSTTHDALDEMFDMFRIFPF